MFATERERREAWEAHRERLMAEYLEPPLVPGRRPVAWWEFEAERPQYLTEISERELDLATTTRRGHEREVESLTWMALHGHLTRLELETLERRAAEARERIGTDREEKAALKPGLRWRQAPSGAVGGRERGAAYGCSVVGLLLRQRHGFETLRRYRRRPAAQSIDPGSSAGGRSTRRAPLPSARMTLSPSKRHGLSPLAPVPNASCPPLGENTGGLSEQWRCLVISRYRRPVREMVAT